MARNNSPKNEKKLEARLWDGVQESDFESNKNIEVVDIAQYDTEMMTYYALNVNMWRQLLKLSDSLKPVERRILYALYKHNGFPGNKLKSTLITGFTAIYHCHGDAYPTMVNMAQNWKKQVPLIKGHGNFGNAAGEFYAADRYTEASMSKYAKECFFDDYDEDCVEMVFNSTSDLYEPITLPSKFPNILVNGGTGIAFGNAFRIPTYNINDIIDVCKRVMAAPETADVFMIPDLPSGCQIVDDGHTFQDICNEGKATMKMRADSEIIDGGRVWIIKFTSIPWMRSLQTIKDKIVELHRKGAITIKDYQDHSYPIKTKNGQVETKIDFRILVDKAHDPKVVLNKLYNLTDLQYSASVDFKVVLDVLEIKKLNMRDLINAWLDERRSYKRRLFNKRLTKVAARIDLLKILIILCTGENLNKTTNIIQNSHEDEACAKLQKLAKMTSYQAAQIYEMKLRAFNADAKKKYEAELKERQNEYNDLMKTIRSEKRIDAIIADELEDLRKYAQPRRSKIVEEESGVHISDTTHSIVVSKQGMIKKLAYHQNDVKRNSNLGSFRSGDYPTHQCVIHNTSNIIFLDSFGRYSIIPVHKIDNTELSQYGHKLYDIAGLSGKIVNVMESPDDDFIEKCKKQIGDPYLVTISRNGYAKKTPMEVFTHMNSKKNIRAMKIRDDDSLAIADIMFDKTRMIIYTEKGIYSQLTVDRIADQAKDSMGLITLRVESDDGVKGYAPIGPDDEYVVILSEKGMIKKVPVSLFGSIARRGNPDDQGCLMTLDPTDSIAFASGIKPGQKVIVGMRNQVISLNEADIPDQTKKAKGKHLVPSGPTANIVVVSVQD